LIEYVLNYRDAIRVPATMAFSRRDSQAMPTDYLRRQLAMLRNWQTLELPL